MALVTNRSAGQQPPGMHDYDDLCDDYTYDELTDGMSTCSGSVNDILDDINVDDLRDSRDLDHLDLDDLTIPDVIKLPAVKSNQIKPSNGYSQKFINGKQDDQVNSKANQGSLYGRIFQTNATVHSQKGTTQEPPVTSVSKNPFADPTSDDMLSEYMTKLQHRSEREKDKKLIVSEPKKFLELVDKSPAGEKCLISEFMQIRENKFNSLSNSASDHNGSSTMVSENRRLSESSGNPRFSQTSLNSQHNFKNSQQNNFNNINSQNNGYNGSTVNSLNRNKTCPSPSFDARHLKNAKWCSNEDISVKDPGALNLPQTWTPRNNPSPSPDKKDFKPVNFDSNSLKRSKRSISTDSGSTNLPPATDSFAWKDTTLDRQLKELKEKTFSDAPDPKAGREGANDKGLDKSLQNWASKPLPKAEDPDVILLKKARQEKKVKRYLEDNFQNREGNYTSEPESNYDSDIGALSSKYTSLDRRRDDERSSPPKSPPPFSKAESRFEREQRIRVGSLDSYTPGSTLSREKSLSPPPAVSAAQKKYERDRFRVEPGRIENYTLGRGSLATQEVYKAGLATSATGCGITKYSGSHSFNPLLLSKSAHNLSVKKGSPSDGPHLQKTLKDGYESDSTLVYRKHQYNPCASPSPQAKALYTQVQKGGDVPLQGLRMQAPEKKEEVVPSIQAFQRDTNQEETPRPSSSVGNTLRRERIERGEQQTEEEIRIRQKQQLNQFYQNIDQQKETQLRVDLESRKHHDTLLPNQKSPVPLNRYEDQDVNGNQALFLNAGKKPDDCKMVARALFSFQAQNNRELSFKKGDIIYIKKQVDGNWYEGERNAMMGIFPTTYVEIVPSDAVVTTLTRKEKNYDGQAKARFNFTAQTPMELSLIKGEIITLTRRIDKNWFEGKIGSRKGIIPVSYVDIMSEPGEGTGTLTKPAASPAAHSILKNGTLPQSSYIPMYDKPKSYTGSASPYSTLSRPGSSMSNGGHHNANDGKPEPTPFRALYNYKPQNDDEVELCEGDIVYVMEKCDDGWFVGTSQRTGIFGTFPGNYVTHI